MLDGVPRGCAGGIVSHGEGETKGIGELGLEFGFPSATPVAIAAARVAEQQEAAGVGIAPAAVVVPPARNRARGKGRRVMRDADGDAASVGPQVVNAVRNRDAERV